MVQTIERLSAKTRYQSPLFRICSGQPFKNPLYHLFKWKIINKMYDNSEDNNRICIDVVVLLKILCNQFKIIRLLIIQV